MYYLSKCTAVGLLCFCIWFNWTTYRVYTQGVSKIFGQTSGWVPRTTSRKRS